MMYPHEQIALEEAHKLVEHMDSRELRTEGISAIYNLFSSEFEALERSGVYFAASSVDLPAETSPTKEFVSNPAFTLLFLMGALAFGALTYFLFYAQSPQRTSPILNLVFKVDPRYQNTTPPEKINLQGKVFFDQNKNVIKPESFKVLNSIAVFLKKHQKLRIRVDGHTDKQGSEQRNLILSKMRARAVVRYLMGRGIQRSRLSFRGFGKKKPLADGNNTVSHAKNRRAELVIQR